MLKPFPKTRLSQRGSAPWLQTLPVVAVFAAFLVHGRVHGTDPQGETAAPVQLYKIEATRNLTYYVVPDDPEPYRHRLDVFRPAGQTGRPVVFFVHGGAWMFGKKDDYFGILGYGTVAQALARHGLVVVLPNYRLSPAVKHPEHIKDVARAFAWTYRNATEYGGDPKQIFLAGHSAGGHLVSLLATDESYLKAEGRSRKDFCGVVSVSGVYCVKDLELEISTWAPGDWLSTTTKVRPFAQVFGTDPKVLEQASPISHVRPGLPPFLLLSAGLDYWPLRRMTKDFAAALQDNSCEVQVKDVPWRTHETLVFDILHRTAEPVTIEEIVDFVDRCRLRSRP
jgi:acetyl esterase/lipase